ncbi:MAG: ABC transporter permease [Oscillospiraceae bacterium]|nr:ABC transporter permease [Oscillospiraceae bacterium]
MIKYIVKRLLLMIPILLCIILIVMILLEITPGDPARIVAGTTATEEEYLKVREDLKLDDPFLKKYFDFIVGAVQLDFGTSFITKTDVFDDIMVRFPYTVILAFASCILAVLLGLPLGIVAATNQNTWKDYIAIFISLICSSMPAFWFALMLVQWFAVKIQIFPVSGIDSWLGWVLPVISQALGFMASIARLTRSSTLEVIRADYITTARAKGVPERSVLYRHVLKNSLIPVVTSVGSMFGMSLGGAMIAETIFSVPGLGTYTLVGLTNRDYPVIKGTVLWLSLLFSVVILLIDVVYAFIDPRIRSQYVKGKKSKKSTDSDGTGSDDAGSDGADSNSENLVAGEA